MQNDGARLIKLFTFFFLLFLLPATLLAQQPNLRCGNNEHRAWWDVQHYELHARFSFEDNAISGYNIITAKTVIEAQSVMQVDMQLPMVVDSVKPEGGVLPRSNKPIPFLQEDDVCYIMIPFDGFAAGDVFKIKIFFHGQPQIASRPPWDGGLVISKDAAGNNWWAMACQGNGASVWFPCKDIRSDEPDEGVEEFYEVPKGYTAVGNGRLQDIVHKRMSDIWYWKTVAPINLYDITFYIGQYEHWQDSYDGENGALSLDYYVLPENLDKSKRQFKEVKAMLQCFENWFGPYPFYGDGYKLVDAPYLGMEHQSAIAYGNEYKKGYLGMDRSGTGYGLDFDFIIVHESAHEWFGNNISAGDIADEWIHEGFASYAEMLYEECHARKEKAAAYQHGKWRTIKNDLPVQGQYNVCDAGSGDCYDKAAALIHIIRKEVDNDSLFRVLLRKMNDTFRYKTINTKDMVSFICAFTNKDFSGIFRQYLTQAQIPELVFDADKAGNVRYKWKGVAADFKMPVIIIHNGKEEWISPASDWQTLPFKANKKTLKISDDFYVKTVWE